MLSNILLPSDYKVPQADVFLASHMARTIPLSRPWWGHCLPGLESSPWGGPTSARDLRRGRTVIPRRGPVDMMVALQAEIILTHRQSVNRGSAAW